MTRSDGGPKPSGASLFPRGMGAPRVLAVEDDPVFRKLLTHSFRRFGLPLSLAENGAELDQALQDSAPDILLLDLGLPGEDGLSIARRIRRRHPRLGIVMITGRGAAQERLQGFQEGADLYFVKPVDLRELEAAIRNLHRRLVPPAPVAGDWSLQPHRSALRSPGGAEIPLTHNEHLFITRLLQQPGAAVERDDLMRALGYAPDPQGAHRLETLVSRLRQKARAKAPDEALPIRARHGSGYVFLGGDT